MLTTTKFKIVTKGFQCPEAMETKTELGKSMLQLWPETVKPMTQSKTVIPQVVKVESSIGGEAIVSYVRWQLQDELGIIYNDVSKNISYYGYSDSNFLDGKLQWFDLVHPEDLESLKISYQDFYVTVKDSTQISHNKSLSYRIVNKNGTIHWVRDLLSVVKGQDDVVLYFQSFILDVTKEKENFIDLKQQHKYMQALHETALGLMNRLDIQSLLDTMLIQLSSLSDNPDAYLFLVNDQEEKLELVAASGIFKLDLGRKLSLGEGASGQVWESKKPLFINDYRSFASRIEFEAFQKFKSVASVPLISSNRVRGVMGYATKEETIFDTKATSILTGFAQLAAMALDNARLFKVSKSALQELEMLGKLNRVITNKLNLQELFNEIVYNISAIFDFTRVSLGTLEGEFVVRVASFGNYEQIPERVSTNEPILQPIFETGKAQFYECPIENSPDGTGTKTHSILVLPLFYDGQITGVLCVGSENRDLTETDKTLMQKAVDQIQIAIKNAKLHAIVHKEVIRSNALYKISQAIQSTDQLTSFMNVIVETTRDAVSPRWIILYKINMTAQVIEEIATTKTSPLRPLSFERLQQGFLGRAITSQKTVFLEKDSPVDGAEGIKEFKERMGIGSTIVTPLVYEKEVLGLMAVLNELSEPDFTDADIQLVESISNQASVALAQYELKQNIEHQAYHDALTGLPNRTLFENRLSLTLAQARRSETVFAVMFLDLDGFKFINDNYGHATGDVLLEKVTQRLESRTRKQDTLARMGGDEFAVILSNLRKESDSMRVAESFRRILTDSFEVDSHVLNVGVSIGVSLFPRDGDDATILLARADSAMYQAKDTGRNRVCSFTPEIAIKAKEKLDLETDLRQAIARNELELYYQPQIDLQSGQRIGVEALLRWFSKTHGFVSPAEFIPIAEESKLILEIGEWVLREACKQNIAWQAQGQAPITVAVNISAIQFESPNFTDLIKSILDSSGLDPKLLELEVTESVVMQDVNVVIERLQELRDMGISIAIDDFGTGYSSLQYLQKLPVDKLKIDRSFVNEISSDTHSPIVLSILALAQSLGLKTVAEGIETKEQLEFLRLYGADEAQGYFFAKPMKASEI